jgi:hypothetical protein
MDGRASTRCTYCRQSRLRSAFTSQGEHVGPRESRRHVDRRARLPGLQRPRQRGGRQADQPGLSRALPARSVLVPDRYGNPPPPPVITARLPFGGVIKATLHADGPSFRLASRQRSPRRCGSSTATKTGSAVCSRVRRAQPTGARRRTRCRPSGAAARDPAGGLVQVHGQAQACRRPGGLRRRLARQAAGAHPDL